MTLDYFHYLKGSSVPGSPVTHHSATENAPTNPGKNREKRLAPRISQIPAMQ